MNIQSCQCDFEKSLIKSNYAYKRSISLKINFPSHLTTVLTPLSNPSNSPLPNLTVIVFTHQSKRTTRQMLNMHRFNICLVVVLSLSCSGVKTLLGVTPSEVCVCVGGGGTVFRQCPVGYLSGLSQWDISAVITL